jgi:hypothetical protein
MAKSVAVAIVQSRLDYCNSLFFGTSQHNIRKLQRIQNTLARIVVGHPLAASSSELLYNLHRLPVHHRYPVHTVGPSDGSVRVCVRVSVCPSFGPSLCPSDNFSDANPDATSDRPSDGPDFCPTFCPTFSRRGYCKNNDHVSPLAGRRHGAKSTVANFRTAKLGHRTCCNTVLVCWHCCLFIL